MAIIFRYLFPLFWCLLIFLIVCVVGVTFRWIKVRKRFLGHIVAASENPVGLWDFYARSDWEIEYSGSFASRIKNPRQVSLYFLKHETKVEFPISRKWTGYLVIPVKSS